MIFISKITAELGGTIALNVTRRSVAYENAARINRVKTLDGSSVFSHFGVSDTDRDVLIEGKLSLAQSLKMLAFFKAAVPLRFGLPEGAFIGYISDLRIGRDLEMNATLYFKEKLTA